MRNIKKECRVFFCKECKQWDIKEYLHSHKGHNTINHINSMLLMDPSFDLLFKQLDISHTNKLKEYKDKANFSPEKLNAYKDLCLEEIESYINDCREYQKEIDSFHKEYLEQREVAKKNLIAMKEKAIVDGKESRDGLLNLADEIYVLKMGCSFCSELDTSWNKLWSQHQMLIAIMRMLNCLSIEGRLKKNIASKAVTSDELSKDHLSYTQAIDLVDKDPGTISYKDCFKKSAEKILLKINEIKLRDCWKAKNSYKLLIDQKKSIKAFLCQTKQFIDLEPIEDEKIWFICQAEKKGVSYLINSSGTLFQWDIKDCKTKEIITKIPIRLTKDLLLLNNCVYLLPLDINDKFFKVDVTKKKMYRLPSSTFSGTKYISYTTLSKRYICCVMSNSKIRVFDTLNEEAGWTMHLNPSQIAGDKVSISLQISPSSFLYRTINGFIEVSLQKQQNTPNAQEEWSLPTDAVRHKGKYYFFTKIPSGFYVECRHASKLKHIIIPPPGLKLKRVAS